MISASIELQTGLEVTPRGTVTGKAPGGLWFRTDRVRFNGPIILTTAMGRGRSLLHGLEGVMRNEKGASSDPYLPGTPLVQYLEGGHLRFYTEPQGLMQ